jgi:hypothetical protein
MVNVGGNMSEEYHIFNKTTLFLLLCICWNKYRELDYRTEHKEL